LIALSKVLQVCHTLGYITDHCEQHMRSFPMAYQEKQGIISYRWQTMCFFGAMPRPARETSAPKQLERAKAIHSAIKAIQKDQAKRRKQFAMKYRGPYGKERTDLDFLHFGALCSMHPGHGRVLSNLHQRKERL